MTDRIAESPPPEVAVTVYRIALEALTNAGKHARASTVEVLLESREGGVYLRVADDGVGFDPDDAETPGHLGLPSMQERAEIAGGWCRVQTRPSQETTVEAWVPSGPASEELRGTG